MADMRVHELAKEFGIENKEFVARLIEMKIPIKSHSSTLNDAFVARIRKQLEPELAERMQAAEAERQAEADRLADEERQQNEVAEAERRKAVEEERARRREEQALREGKTVEQLDAEEADRKRLALESRTAGSSDDLDEDESAAVDADALSDIGIGVDARSADGSSALDAEAVGTKQSAAEQPATEPGAELSAEQVVAAASDEGLSAEEGLAVGEVGPIAEADAPMLDITEADLSAVLEEGALGAEGDFVGADALVSVASAGDRVALDAAADALSAAGVDVVGAAGAAGEAGAGVAGATGEAGAVATGAGEGLAEVGEAEQAGRGIAGELTVVGEGESVAPDAGLATERDISAETEVAAETTDGGAAEAQVRADGEAQLADSMTSELVGVAANTGLADVIATAAAAEGAATAATAAAAAATVDNAIAETAAASSDSSDEATAKRATTETTAEATDESAAAAEATLTAAEVAAAPARFSGLLAQIEAENRRLADEAEAQAAQAAAQVAAADSRRASRGRSRRPAVAASAAPAEEQQAAGTGTVEIKFEIPDDTQVEDTQAGDSRTNRGRRRGSAVTEEDGAPGRSRSRSRREESSPLIISPLPADYADYDDDFDKDEEDRYRRMAQAAEQFQRDRVIAEARAAVEAASSEGEGRRRQRRERREAEARERIELEAIERGIDVELLADDVIQVTSGSTVGEVAEAMKVPANEVIKRLFLLGMMMTVTQTMSDELIELIADDMELKVRIISPEEEYAVTIFDAPEDLKPRPPVITVMGHVDHGKTSLLDAIRSTGVVATEAGGITQHIGASVVDVDGRQITFIDTPGHEAFTAMRARGAKVTDVVVLVVAADDGVMPQTVEAISHANAADVPIVVAINKIDRPDANLDRVRAELAEHGIITEAWGGQNLFVEVSAREHIGIDDLLETILLQADILELKANANAAASGFVIEAKLDRGRGPIATVLVQRGTLKVGDMLVAGTSYGRVRALINSQGDNISSAYPADPVEVLGLGSVPEAGDEFRVFTDERDARNLAEDRALRKRLAEQQPDAHVTLEDLFARMEGGLSELNLVVKADVQGSIEALKDALDKMDQSEVKINVIHSAVGGITETDVTLAAASDAVIIGFNVRPESKARLAAEQERVEIKTYRVIYQAIDDINAARIGMLKPDLVEEQSGIAEVREVYRVPRAGNIAGCFVDSGEVRASDLLRIVRNGTIIFESKVASLRHYRDDVDVVHAGSDCGIGIDGYQDIKVGDVIETYRIREVARES